MPTKRKAAGKSKAPPKKASKGGRPGGAPKNAETRPAKVSGAKKSKAPAAPTKKKKKGGKDRPLAPRTEAEENKIIALAKQECLRQWEVQSRKKLWCPRGKALAKMPSKRQWLIDHGLSDV